LLHALVAAYKEKPEMMGTQAAVVILIVDRISVGLVAALAGGGITDEIAAAGL